MKLYSFTGSCALASNIVMEWIGMPYEVVLVDRDDIKKDFFLKLNPLGKVPVLDVDGWILDENAAILNYLADTHPDAGLNGGDDPRQRAEVTRWLGFVNSELHPAYKPLFGATAYLEDDAAIEKTKANAKARVRQLFELCDKQLAEHAYLAGERSIADAYLFVTLAWTHRVGIDLDGLTHVQAYEKRMRGDAGVQAALKAQKVA